MLRTTLLLGFFVLFSVACATSPPVTPDRAAERGTLGSGGAVRGTRSDGGRWALSLEDSDVLLEVDGAAVRFLEGAPGGFLAYEHVEATETWRIRLASGVAECRGRELDFQGREYRLHPGGRLLFDRKGAWVSDLELEEAL